MFNCIVAVIVFVLSGPFVRAEFQTGALTPPPPMAVERKITVQRGDAVQIPLGIHGPASRAFFAIRSKPRHGKLGDPEPTGDSTGVVVYRSNPTGENRSDRFSYAAKTSRGVSAPATVLITIVDEPPALVVPDEVDFGEVRAGEIATRTMEISNPGGGSADGEFQIDSPFRIENAERFAVRSRRTVSFVIALNTAQDGTWKQTLRYGGFPGYETVLKATVTPEIRISPLQLTLVAGESGTGRSGKVRIENTANETRRLEFLLGPRLKGPESVELAPAEVHEITISTEETDFNVVDEKIQILAGAWFKAVHISAPVVGARLKSPDGLVFPAAKQGASVSVTLPLSNEGGERMYLDVQPEPPFALGKDQTSVSLESGSSANLEITADTSVSGSFQKSLRLKAYDKEWVVPVSIVITPDAGKPENPEPVFRSFAAPTLPGIFTGTTNVAAGVIPQTSVPMFMPGYLVKATRNSITLGWLMPDNPSGHRLEERILSFTPQRELDVRWEPVDDVIWETKGGFLHATAPGRQPGCAFTFRLVVLDASGKTQSESFPTTARTLPPWRLRVSLLTVIFWGIALTAAGVIFQKIRNWLAWRRKMFSHG